MKYVIRTFFLAVLLAVLPTACGEDETSPLIGTWELESESATACTDPLDNYSMNYTCTSSDCTKITFKSGGKLKLEFEEDDVTISLEGTWEKSDGMLTVCVNGDCDEPAAYEISNGTLTLSGSDASTGCTMSIVLKKS
jgi:hypothetical protein